MSNLTLTNKLIFDLVLKEYNIKANSIEPVSYTHLLHIRIIKN